MCIYIKTWNSLLKCWAKFKPQHYSSQLWSLQLWTQFKQLRIQAWKSQDFNGVWTCDLAIPRCDALSNWAMRYGIITNLKCARLGTKIQNHFLFVPRKKNSSSNAVVQTLRKRSTERRTDVEEYKLLRKSLTNRLEHVKKNPSLSFVLINLTTRKLIFQRKFVLCCCLLLQISTLHKARLSTVNYSFSIPIVWSEMLFFCYALFLCCRSLLFAI